MIQSQHLKPLAIATAGVSAFLLFLIQPMMAKIVLPQLGGAPAVWNASMLFYQALLLGGYYYAYRLSRHAAPARQTMLHLAILVASLLLLPLGLHAAEGIDRVHAPVQWLLMTLLWSVGLPFFILSANAPLLQHWFARSGHSESGNPYFLYAASNIGSFAALLSYPLLIEPWFTVPQQLAGWTWGYGLFLLLIAGLILILKQRGTPTALAEHKAEAVVIPPLFTRLRWVLLAFVPSSLMLGVTQHITTDIAPVPLLWIVPLALYLLSFVLVFGRGHWIYRRCLDGHVTLTVLVAFLMVIEAMPVMTVCILHLFLFFSVAMVCHGQLAESKPDTGYLTQFYVLMSLGGVLGGMFNTLLAPALFNSILEYPLMLVVACFMRPPQSDNNSLRTRMVDLVMPFMLMLALVWLHTWYSGTAQQDYAAGIARINEALAGLRKEDPVELSTLIRLGFFLLFVVLIFFSYKRPLRFGMLLMVLLGVVPTFREDNGDKQLHVSRNFYGVSRVVQSSEKDIMMFMHGTTLHGLQSMNPANRLTVASYYYVMKDALPYLPEIARVQPVAAVGMGVATVACTASVGQNYDFYEINPEVEIIARNKDFFTYVSDCPAKVNVILGDARLKLNEAADGRYGLMILDAYSSDALPMHLLTLEALKMYQAKLMQGGVMAFNISNRHLDLKPILANLAEAIGMVAYVRESIADNKLLMSAQWVLIGEEEAFSQLIRTKDWTRLTPNGRTPWSDDFSNVLEALRR